MMRNILFVGQAMPKPPYPDRPFGRTKLYNWFADAGIPEPTVIKRFYFGALLSYYPGSKNGSHLVPTHEQINKDRPNLEILFYEVDPSVVVPVGKLSISYALGIKDPAMSEVIGKEFLVDPYKLVGRALPVIPIPHPSGASSWIYKPGNRQLLSKSLARLKSYL